MAGLDTEQNARHPLVEQFERWARGALTRGFPLEDAAVATSSSKRTLARRMQAVLGKSPCLLPGFTREAGGAPVEDHNQSVEEIAGRVGYADDVTLRNLLRSRLGHGIKEIRRSL